MKQVIYSAVLIILLGYIGMMVHPDFGIVCAIAVATACIIYTLQQRDQKEEEHEEE